MTVAKKKGATGRGAKSEPDEGLEPVSAFEQEETAAEFAQEETAAETATAVAVAFAAPKKDEVSFAALKDDAVAINAEAFEALRVNAEANFDFLKALFAAKSPSEVIRLQTEFARRQVETMTSQARNLGALTQKAMTDAAESIKEQVAKSFRIAV
jgi:phasin family protein